MSKHLSKRVFISSPPEADAKMQAYASHMRNKGILVCVNDNINTLTNCDVMVLVLMEGSDTQKAKKDLNYALDHAKPVVCLTIGNPVLDAGLSIQLGLATKIADEEKGLDKLMRAIYTARKPVNRYRQKQIFFACVILAVLLVFSTFIPKKETKKENKKTEKKAEEVVVSEVPTLEMEPELLQALLDNGMDANKDGGITKEELEKAIALDLSGYGISDISPVIYATQIIMLDISDNNISDITALVALTELETLNISGNPIEDTSCLNYLSKLKTLVTE